MDYKTENLNLEQVDFYDLNKTSKYIAKFKNLKELTIRVYQHAHHCYEKDEIGICIKTKNESDNPFKALLNHPSIERLDIVESRRRPMTKEHVEHLSKVVKQCQS